MGLEKHIFEELEKSSLPFIEGEDYFFDDGLVVHNSLTAERIMEALDESGHFGPTRFNEKENRIEIGTHRVHFNPFKKMKYETYAKQFKKGKF